MQRRGSRAGARPLLLAAAAGVMACAAPAAKDGDAQARAPDSAPPTVPERPTPRAPAAPTPTRAATETAQQPVHGRYIGREIGVHYGRHPDMSTLALPDGLRLHAAVTHADGWRIVVAERDDDLALLLTDDDGVVLDDRWLDGVAADSVITFHCGDDISVSLIAADACADERGTAPALRTWLPRAGSLVEAEAGARCDCDML
ncbi:MAG: hypothetical protein H6713_39530 [Myxococcales bacterium]|nr:hypothetical protein [Myxococcales bacterium]MCB9756053.1 hypothetical protein [Myxococcales bacterium]